MPEKVFGSKAGNLNEIILACPAGSVNPASGRQVHEK